MADDQTVLQRFHSVLVREFLSRPPWDLNAPLIVADIKNSLVPYEVRRDELGITTVADYDQTLLRLLDGQGGHLRVGDKKASQKIREHFDSSSPSSPDASVLSEVLAADVHINPMEKGPPMVEESKEHLPHFENCPSCTEALPKEERVNFCPFCGDDVQRVLCPSCSRKLRLNWLFCVACGTEIEPETGL